jgi:hypothetical protein
LEISAKDSTTRKLTFKENWLTFERLPWAYLIKLSVRSLDGFRATGRSARNSVLPLAVVCARERELLIANTRMLLCHAVDRKQGALKVGKNCYSAKRPRFSRTDHWSES